MAEITIPDRLPESYPDVYTTEVEAWCRSTPVAKSSWHGASPGALSDGNAFLPDDALIDGTDITVADARAGASPAR